MKSILFDITLGKDTRYMSLNAKLGAEGEKLALQWLLDKRYTVLHRNWRYSHYEIDLIATKKSMLHIIEVKCRQGSKYGYPEESVTKKKFRNLQRATDQFLYLNPGYRWIQYDILSILLPPGQQPVFFLLEDVYL